MYDLSLTSSWNYPSTRIHFFKRCISLLPSWSFRSFKHLQIISRDNVETCWLKLICLKFAPSVNLCLFVLVFQLYYYIQVEKPWIYCMACFETIYVYSRWDAWLAPNWVFSWVKSIFASIFLSNRSQILCCSLYLSTCMIYYLIFTGFSRANTWNIESLHGWLLFSLLVMIGCLLLIKHCLSNCRMQEIKHFKQEGMQKHWSIIVLFYQPTFNHDLLQQSVYAIAPLHTKVWIKLVMQLVIAA